MRSSLLPLRPIHLLAALLLGGCDSGDPSTDASSSGGGEGPEDTGSISIPAGQNVATLAVTVGSPTLPVGDHELASIGFAPQRNQDEFYANFGQDDGITVLRTLNFYGLHRVGSFDCGERAKPNDDYAISTSIDLKDYAGGEFYDASVAGSSCTVTVTRIDASVIEGKYSGKLLSTSDPANSVTVAGEFRAHAAG